MYFLGLDYSTQKLKAIVIDVFGSLIIENSIDYDLDLSHYRTINGVYKYKDGKVLAPTIMWIEATDQLFKRLVLSIDLSKIIAICGSAQQHTTIFWNHEANYKLSNLDSKLLLIDQLKTVFSKSLSPTWMDSSTNNECNIIENKFGGKEKLQCRLGSSLANRFSAPQILKAFSEDENLINITKHITLVSNGMCSIFAGKIVGMDVSDAAGTGLQSCGSLDWDSDICNIIAPNFISKLGEITKSNYVVGNLNSYFVDRYQMSAKCQVVSFTGDNPSSVVGMLLSANDICISMGTSDTLFACLPQLPKIVPNIPTFVFPHPLYPDIFVTLLCYKNGSQTREVIRKQYSVGDWNKFTDILNLSPPGNNGVFGVFYDLEEIIPPGMIGRYFENFKMKDSDKVLEESLDKSTIIRSLIEGQLLSKYYHFAQISSNHIESFGKLLITGGASINKSILQIAADIFNKDVVTIDTTNSAAVGSVFRAVFATQNDIFFKDFVDRLHFLKTSCHPENSEIYKTLIPDFVQFFERVQQKNV